MNRYRVKNFKWEDGYIYVRKFGMWFKLDNRYHNRVEGTRLVCLLVGEDREAHGYWGWFDGRLEITDEKEESHYESV